MAPEYLLTGFRELGSNCSRFREPYPAIGSIGACFTGRTGGTWKGEDKACEVRNVLAVGDLHELDSLPDPLEDHDTAVSNETACDEEPVIRSTELHPANLF